jgi:hypothetical protein
VLAASDRKPACSDRDGGEQSERHHSRHVLVFITHRDGHDEHDAEVRLFAVRLKSRNSRLASGARAD